MLFNHTLLLASVIISLVSAGFASPANKASSKSTHSRKDTTRHPTRVPSPIINAGAEAVSDADQILNHLFAKRFRNLKRDTDLQRFIKEFRIATGCDETILHGKRGCTLRSTQKSARFITLVEGSSETIMDRNDLLKRHDFLQKSTWILRDTNGRLHLYNGLGEQLDPEVNIPFYYVPDSKYSLLSRLSHDFVGREVIRTPIFTWEPRGGALPNFYGELALVRESDGLITLSSREFSMGKVLLQLPTEWKHGKYVYAPIPKMPMHLHTDLLKSAYLPDNSMLFTPAGGVPFKLNALGGLVDYTPVDLILSNQYTSDALENSPYHAASRRSEVIATELKFSVLPVTCEGSSVSIPLREMYTFTTRAAKKVPFFIEKIYSDNGWVRSAIDRRCTGVDGLVEGFFNSKGDFYVFNHDGGILTKFTQVPQPAYDGLLQKKVVKTSYSE